MATQIDRNRRGIDGQSTYYTQCPRRRIVERWTQVIDGDLQYPVAMMTLECGHTDYYRGQKSHVRCGSCLSETPVDVQRGWMGVP